MKKLSKKAKRYDRDRSLNLLERAVRGFDDLIAPVLAAANKQLGRLPSCATCTTPGCCSQMVLVTLVEAAVVARHLLRVGRDTQGLRRHLNKLGGEQQKLGRHGWWRAARPCSFLKDGRCSIYEVRPVMCRTWSAWSEPRPCQPPAAHDVTTVEMVGVGRALVQLNTEVCGQLGLDDCYFYAGNLPRMLGLALRFLDLGSARGVEFLKGQEFMTPLKMMAWFGRAAGLQEGETEVQ